MRHTNTDNMLIPKVGGILILLLSDCILLRRFVKAAYFVNIFSSRPYSSVICILNRLCKQLAAITEIAFAVFTRCVP
jgi:hypothetical protein